jgi:hypothetical protein
LSSHPAALLPLPAFLCTPRSSCWSSCSISLCPAPESTLPWPLWSSRAPSCHSPPSNYLHPLARAVIHGGRASRARNSASRASTCTSLSKVRVYLPEQLSCEFYISIISTRIPGILLPKFI